MMARLGIFFGDFEENLVRFARGQAQEVSRPHVGVLATDAAVVAVTTAPNLTTGGRGAATEKKARRGNYDEETT